MQILQIENSMLCQAYLHDEKPILSLCLNPNCVISSLCCSVCLDERHLKHQDDIKDKITVTELLQNFINEQTLIENELKELNNEHQVLKQIQEFISGLRLSFTQTLSLLKNDQLEETNGGLMEVKQWYKFFYVQNFQLREQIMTLKESNIQEEALSVLKLRVDEIQQQILNSKGLQLNQYGFQIEAIDHKNYEVLCNLIDSLITGSKFQEADKLFEQGFQFKEDHLRLYHSKARLLYFNKQFDESLEQIEKVLQINPKYSRSVDLKGLLLFQKGQIEESLKLYQEAMIYDSECSFPYYHSSIALVYQKKFDEANKLIDLGIKLGSYPIVCLDHKSTNLYNQEWLLIEEQKYDEAQQIIDKILKLNYKHLQSLYSKVDYLKYRNKLEEAIHYLENIIQIYPNELQAYKTLGLTLLEQKEINKAIKIYEKVLEIDPKDDIIRGLLGGLMVNQNRLDEFNSMLKADQFQDQCKILYIQVLTLVDYGNWQETLKNIEKLQPENQMQILQTHCMKAVFLAANDQKDEAKSLISSLQQAFKNSEMLILVQMFSALTLAVCKEYEEAIQQFDNLIKQAPQILFLQISKCFCLIDLQKFQEANKLLDDLLPRDQNSLGLILKGYLLLREKKMNEAQQYLVKAIETDSIIADLLLSEGDQLKSLEDEQFAAQLMEKLFLKIKNNPALLMKYSLGNFLS